MTRLALTFSALLLCLACTRTPLQVVPSSRPYDVNSAKVGKRARGESCVTYLFGLVPLGDLQSLPHALDLAKAAAGSDVLAEVTVEATWAWWLILTTQCVEVSGLAVRGGGAHEIVAPEPEPDSAAALAPAEGSTRREATATPSPARAQECRSMCERLLRDKWAEQGTCSTRCGKSDAYRRCLANAKDWTDCGL